MVLADGDKLVRVFENLIINAIAYGNDGDYIDITAYENNNMIAIDITNYGQPIPSTDLPHIFERFIALRNRALQTLVDLDSDWQCKSIVELHKGTIEVYSDDKNNIHCKATTI